MTRTGIPELFTIKSSCVNDTASLSAAPNCAPHHTNIYIREFVWIEYQSLRVARARNLENGRANHLGF